jgi:hypothetical protein
MQSWISCNADMVVGFDFREKREGCEKGRCGEGEGRELIRDVGNGKRGLRRQKRNIGG